MEKMIKCICQRIELGFLDISLWLELLDLKRIYHILHIE